MLTIKILELNPIQNCIMLNNQTKKVAFVLTSITFGFNIFACLTSCIVFIILIYHLYNIHMKRTDRITVLLCSIIYLATLIYTTILLSMNIRTILGDLYGQSFNSFWCIFSGYLCLISLCMWYITFINQVITNNVN